MTPGRIVVKVGSSTLAGQTAGIDVEYVASLVAQVCELKDRGWQPVVVSSGAITAGVERLAWSRVRRTCLRFRPRRRWARSC